MVQRSVKVKDMKPTDVFYKPMNINSYLIYNRPSTTVNPLSKLFKILIKIIFKGGGAGLNVYWTLNRRMAMKANNKIFKENNIVQ